MIRIVTLGAAEVHGVIRPIPAGRPLAALIFLSLQRQMVQRQDLVDVLWDSGVVRAERHSLSQLVYALKRCLPADVLISKGDHLGLSAARASADFSDFFQAFRAKNYAEATALYRGGFLTGFPIISEGFEDWRAEHAAAAECAAIQSYRLVVEHKLASEDNSDIPDLCSKALQIARHDPFFIRVQIESLAAQNDIGGALASYGLHRRVLLREAGAVPPWMNEEFVARISGLSQIDLPAEHSDIAVPFVGRTEHLKQLRNMWEKSQNGRQAVRLIGEAGVGKSRLLIQFVRRTALEGARVHLHTCAESEFLLPYAAIVGLLLSNYRPEVSSTLAPQLRGALASVAPEIHFDGDLAHYQQRVVFEAFAKYFTAVAGSQRLVLALDDFQWSDEVSRDALSYVIRRLDQAPSLILVAARSDPQACGADLFISNIMVERMNAGEVDQLIEHYERRYAQVFDKTTIYKKSGGNPFFVLQLIRYLSDNTGENSAATSGAAIPASISRILQSRVTRLSEAARRTAAAVAVIGRPASVSSLCEVSGLSEIDVANGIDELVRIGIVQDGHNCEFVHDLMRLAAYEDTSIALRQVLHHRAAISLQNAGTSSGELAHHFEQAALKDESWRHARAAAQEAVRLGAYREADAQFQRMIRCAMPDNNLQTHAEYLSFLCHASRIDDAYPYVNAAERYAVDTCDAELKVLCRLVRFELDALYSLEGARQLIEDAQQSCPDLLPKVIRSMIEIVRGDGAADGVRSLAQMLRQETTGRAAAHRHAAAGLITGILDGYEDGLRVVEHAVTLAEQSEDAAALSSALFARGALRLIAGMCTGARDDYLRVLKLSDIVGSGDYSHGSASNLAVVYMEQDDFEAAEECALKALTSVFPIRRPFAAANLALLYCRRGDYEISRKYIHLLESSPTRELQKWIPVQALAFRGLCSVGEQDWESAMQIEGELASFTPVESLPVDLSTIHEFIGQVIAVRDSASKAETYLLEMSDKAKRFDYLAGARLALLATQYFAGGQAARIESIAAPIFDRATRFGAIALARQASGVLESLGSLKHPKRA